AANWYANRVDIEGSPFLQMSVQLYNSYDDTDLRKILFTDESAAQPIGQPADGSDIILVGKYQAQGSAGLLVQHVPVFRTTEMYLIKAECEARDGRLNEAAATLHQIWLARYQDGTAPPPANFGSSTAALKAVL